MTKAESADTGVESPALEALADTARSRFHTSEDAAAAFIRDAIGRGIFRPGDHLNQGRIGELLGMSRIPIRNSLRQLQAERLVTINRFRGATVSVLTIEDIDEIYELRAAVECMTLTKVAQNLTPELVEELRAHAEQLDDVDVVKSRWAEARQNFYDLLFGVSGQSRMTELVSDLRREVAGYVAVYDVAEAHAGHLDLLNMLAKGDVDGAQDWHRKHILGVRDRLAAAIRAQGPLVGSEGDGHPQAG